MAATKTLEERKNDFIERLKKLYPDYKLISEYVNGNTFIELIHVPTGEIWKTKPRYLDGKRQAPGVARSIKDKNTTKLTHEEFEEKFYKIWSKEDYEIVGAYSKMTDKIEILCKKCNKIFTPTAKNILYKNKKGCVHCYGKNKKDINDYQEIFNQDIELKNYTILEIFSKDGHVYGKIIHNCDNCENHIFTIRISDMISKHQQRCPKCSLIYGESKAVKDIKDFLNENSIKFEQEKKFKTCKNINELPFDFYLLETNILIEYDGIQHFKISFNDEEAFNKQKYRDELKNKWCKDNGYNLIRINYKENHLEILEKELKKLNVI